MIPRGGQRPLCRERVTDDSRSLTSPPAPASIRSAVVDPVDPGEIAVWYRRTESLSDSDLQAIDAVLSDEERLRRDRFVFERDRRDFAAAHALLRTVLSTYEATPPGEWRFERDRHGKPFVSAPQAGTPPLAFNLSHTRGCVCCAIARAARVGVDVERLGRVTDASEIAERYFAAEERRMLKACGADESQARFVELWTLKESYIKAIGLGLGIPWIRSRSCSTAPPASDF